MRIVSKRQLEVPSLFPLRICPAEIALAFDLNLPGALLGEWPGQTWHPVRPASYVVQPLVFCLSEGKNDGTFWLDSHPLESGNPRRSRLEAVSCVSR